MNVITIPKKYYKDLVERQVRVEKELLVLRELVKTEIEEKYIKPAILKWWERIGRDLDKGKGRVFYSSAEMRAWLSRL